MSGALNSLPAVSVVVPFYDSEAFIVRCLESLLNQDEAGPFEVLLIDNGSKDGSRRLVEHYDQVTLLTEETPGAYSARNTGIRAAHAPLIAFTDADCRVAPDWLRTIRRAMQDPRVGILIGHCRYPAEASLALRLLGAYENSKTKYVVEKCSSAYQYAYANNMVVRAALFDQIGPFQEWKRAADSELVHRMAVQRPDLRLAYSSEMKITHLEFLAARKRLERLRLYSTTNSKIADFRELGMARRLAILLRLLWPL